MIDELKKLRKEFPRPFAEFNMGGECERTGYNESRIDEWLEKFDVFIKSQEETSKRTGS